MSKIDCLKIYDDIKNKINSCKKVIIIGKGKTAKYIKEKN